MSGYTLVCFGGAGGQHACLVAEQLGVTQIHIHPMAGVLSAIGIGLADVRTVDDRSVERPLDETVLAELGPQWTTLEATGHAVVLGQGVEAERISSERRLAIRYSGSDTTLMVDAGSLAAVTEGFEAPIVSTCIDSTMSSVSGATKPYRA